MEHAYVLALYYPLFETVIKMENQENDNKIQNVIEIYKNIQKITSDNCFTLIVIAIDELLKIQNPKLQQTYLNFSDGGEKWFKIADLPDKHCQTLAFIFLSLGYQGKYSNDSQSHNHFRESLYAEITSLYPNKRKTKRLNSMLKQSLIIVALVSLILTYLSFYLNLALELK